MVARETELSRAEAEEAVRELRVRALEFEESLTRRQDDAQQEFLVLHNQAVAHAERITQDANEQVDRVARARAARGVEGRRLRPAHARAGAADRGRREHARPRAARPGPGQGAEDHRHGDGTHSQSVLRDAEDRTRQLRWQQHQLTSFMAEVNELIRPETPFDASDAESVELEQRPRAEPSTARAVHGHPDRDRTRYARAGTSCTRGRSRALGRDGR